MQCVRVLPALPPLAGQRLAEIHLAARLPVDIDSSPALSAKNARIGAGTSIAKEEYRVLGSLRAGEEHQVIEAGEVGMRIVSHMRQIRQSEAGSDRHGGQQRWHETKSLQRERPT